MAEQPPPLGPDGLAEITAYLRARWSEERTRQERVFRSTWRYRDPCTECDQPATNFVEYIGHDQIDAEFEPCGCRVHDPDHLSRYREPAGDRAVLADLAAKEDLLTDLLTDQHTICMDDYWYTCCAATVERDGGTCPGNDHDHQNACTCGLSTVTARRLRILAAPYASRPDFEERWRR